MTYEIAEHGVWSDDFTTSEVAAALGFDTRLTEPEQVAPAGLPDSNAIDGPVFEVPGVGAS